MGFSSLLAGDTEKLPVPSSGRNPLEGTRISGWNAFSYHKISAGARHQAEKPSGELLDGVLEVALGFPREHAVVPVENRDEIRR
jgi:hypothetical protein